MARMSPAATDQKVAELRGQLIDICKQEAGRCGMPVKMRRLWPRGLAVNMTAPSTTKKAPDSSVSQPYRGARPRPIPVTRAGQLARVTGESRSVRYSG